MYVSNDPHVLREFNAQSKRANVLSGAFSPLGHSFAQELITNPAHAVAMANLDTAGFQYNLADLMDITWNFTYRGNTNGIKLFKSVPGKGPGRDALIWDLIDGLKMIDSHIENDRARLLKFWTYTGVTYMHPHPFVSASINVAGSTTLIQGNRKIPPNSIGLIPPWLEHASPIVPTGKYRLYAVVFRSIYPTA